MTARRIDGKLRAQEVQDAVRTRAQDLRARAGGRKKVCEFARKDLRPAPGAYRERLLSLQEELHEPEDRAENGDSPDR